VAVASMGNGGGTQVDGELVNSRFLLALRLRIDADEVGGTPGQTAWHGRRPCMRDGWRGRVRARRVAPVRCVLGLGAMHGGRRGGDPMAARGPPGSCRGFRTSEGCADATWPARPQRAHDALGAATASATPLLFHLSVFAKAKLEKVTTNLKISKNKSCRGTIDLQLSQRASYVLINHLSGNVGRSCRFSTAWVTVHNAVNSIFGQFALKIGMSANYEKCVPRNNEQLSYWPILNFYNEIWRTLKKTESTFLRSRVLTMTWDFDQGFFCANVCTIMSNMFRS
jgi:hypothetical protein